MAIFNRFLPKAGPGSHARIVQLDGLRGIAILLVFAYHAFKANLMWMGVDLFFVLSGFLITGILLDQKKKRFGAYLGGFYSRRVRRIIPAYLVILAVSAIVFGLGWLRYWYMYLGAMNFIAPFGIPQPPVLPLWSLAAEEQFYLLWPIAVFCLSRKRLTILTWTLLAAAPILRFICAPLFVSGHSTYMLLPFRMDTLALGALAAIYWPDLEASFSSDSGKRKRAVRLCGVIFAIALATALVMNSAGYLPTNGSRVGSAVLLEATLGIVGGMFALAMLGLGKKVLSSWPLVFVGTISYSMYLFHMTAIYLAPHNNGLIALAASLLYSTAMWVLVERPILNYRRST